MCLTWPGHFRLPVIHVKDSHELISHYEISFFPPPQLGPIRGARQHLTPPIT
jgi:hypothetical protein